MSNGLNQNHTNQPSSFINTMPDRLNTELELADRLGIKPCKIGEPEFDEIINQGTIKWAMITIDEILIIPHYANGREINHTVISRGQPVLAAGDAEIVGNNGQYILLSISNYSGHFQPDKNSLNLAISTWKKQGVDVSQVEIN